MVKTKQTNNNKWQAIKAYAALTILAGGFVRTLVVESQKNNSLVMILGVVTAFFCVSAVVEYLRNKV